MGTRAGIMPTIQYTVTKADEVKVFETFGGDLPVHFHAVKSRSKTPG